MKIQQISRFRLGTQGQNAGYQISGASKYITPIEEAKFTGMFTTLTLNNDSALIKDKIPYILDCAMDDSAKTLFISQIYKGVSGSRITPYVHALILDENQINTYYSQPEDFFRFDSSNFQSICGDMEKKEILPELSGLVLKDTVLDVNTIRQKYNLIDEQVYRNFLSHIYETILSNGTVNMVFGTNQEMKDYDDIIKDMMFLVFSSIPMILRKKVSFSSSVIAGVKTRMFTLVSESECENSNSSWFNLRNGHSSELKGNVSGSLFKIDYISYLATLDDGHRKDFLQFIDDYFCKVFNRPDMKDVSTLGNIFVAAFLSYNVSVRDKYYTRENAANILNSLIRVKVNNQDVISELLGTLLKRAVELKARINDVQFKNLQTYYLKVNSDIYEEAFVHALSTRDNTTIKKLFVEALKSESNEKNDKFIARLLSDIPDVTEILTEDVLQNLASRYPITKSKELEEFYLNYMDNLYSDTMSMEAASSQVEAAVKLIAIQEEKGVLYLDRQLKQLTRYNLKIENKALQQLFDVCKKFGNKYSVVTKIYDYYIKVYFDGVSNEVLDNYQYLLQQDSRIVQIVQHYLEIEKSNIQDIYYSQRLFPKRYHNLHDEKSFSDEIVEISQYPVYDESMKKISDYFKDSMYKRMICRVDKSQKKKLKEKKSQNQSDKIHVNILQNRYNKVIQYTEAIFGKHRDICNTLKEEFIDIFWDVVDITTINKDLCSELKESMYCAGNKSFDNVVLYWDTVSEFMNNLHEDSGYSPTESEIKILTTEFCINSISILNYRLKEMFEKLHINDEEMSADVLLMKYYDLEEKKFISTEFLQKLTENQEEAIQNNDLTFPYIHEPLLLELQKYMHKKRKYNRIKEIFLQKGDKKVFFIIGGVVTITLLVVVIIASLIIIRSQSNEVKKPVPESNISIETKETKATDITETLEESETAIESAETKEDITTSETVDNDETSGTRINQSENEDSEVRIHQNEGDNENGEIRIRQNENDYKDDDREVNQNEDYSSRIDENEDEDNQNIDYYNPYYDESSNPLNQFISPIFSKSYSDILSKVSYEKSEMEFKKTLE